MIPTLLRCALLFGMAAITQGEELELRVLIYNIHHGEGTDGKVDLDRIAQVIRDAQADLVLLQEVDRNLPRTNRLDFPAILQDKIGMHAWFEPNLKWDGGEYGNATFTNLNVVDHDNLALPNPHNEEPRGALRLRIEAAGIRFDVWNTHFGLKSGERRAQAEALAAQLSDLPAVAGGDLNEILSNTPLQPLLARLAPTSPSGGHGTVPAVRPLRRIDHILISPQWTVVSDEVVANPLTALASDHLPCVATLRYSGAPAAP
ncbi:MAG: endonuclease/exonuclease/phosphatase family protein [Candidatus Hydrogenedentes bacterium]|nr:endonuclease/exonuclease/phosphatase family protein [Candidatus Hydrogenedentota bacterium]